MEVYRENYNMYKTEREYDKDDVQVVYDTCPNCENAGSK